MLCWQSLWIFFPGPWIRFSLPGLSRQHEWFACEFWFTVAKGKGYHNTVAFTLLACSIRSTSSGEKIVLYFSFYSCHLQKWILLLWLNSWVHQVVVSHSRKKQYPIKETTPDVWTWEHLFPYWHFVSGINNAYIVVMNVSADSIISCCPMAPINTDPKFSLKLEVSNTHTLVQSQPINFKHIDSETKLSPLLSKCIRCFLYHNYCIFVQM